MISEKLIAYILVLIQFSGLFVLALTGPLFASNIVLFIIEILGICLGIWAIFSMNPFRVSVFPLVKDQTEFIKKGPYSIIRHPMYFAIILTIVPLLINSYSHLRLIVTIIILANIIFKLEFEERQMIKHFTGYTAYRKNTYRILPFIY